MVRDAVFDEVVPLLDEAAIRFVVPRFRALADEEVEEKAPGELVTVADREAEAWLTPRLRALVPGSRVIGEEAVARDARLLDGVGRGVVWLLDPLDGTANFVAGRPPFALMAALVRDGEPVGAFVVEPTAGERWIAQRGAGVTLGGAPVRAPPPPPLPEARGAVLTRYLPRDFARHVEARRGRIGDVSPGLRCAGAEYPAIVRGAQHFALFWRTLPWDHVAGALLVTEAGGHVARLDGRPYRAGDPGAGLIAAADAALWRELQRALVQTS